VKFFGQGLLRAKDARTVIPGNNLMKSEADHVSWPWIRLLFGVGAAGEDPQGEMLELETIQLLTGFDELAGPESELLHEDAQPSPSELKAIVDRLIASPRTSNTLREKLKGLRL